METLAHIALWRHTNGGVGAAIMAPGNQSLIDRVKQMFIHDAWYDHGRRLFLFSPAFINVGLRLLGQFFPRDACPICQKMATPCWYWLERGMNVTSLGSLANPPMAKPANDQARMQAMIDATPNALSQIRSASVDVSDALRNREAARLSRRERPARAAVADAVEAIFDRAPPLAQAPTPAGTIRCTHCGQVIPPGFDKTKDSKKTEDEIYAECEHDFDEEKYCRKCKLQQRPEKTSRFSWLEVD